MGERGIGSILVHHLGASNALARGPRVTGEKEGPRPEDELLPNHVHDGVPIWQMLAHALRPSGLVQQVGVHLPHPLHVNDPFDETEAG